MTRGGGLSRGERRGGGGGGVGGCGPESGGRRPPCPPAAPAAGGAASTSCLEGGQLQPAKYQVAGHLRENGKAGALVDAQWGVWYKPLQAGPRGKREVAFYEAFFLGGGGGGGGGGEEEEEEGIFPASAGGARHPTLGRFVPRFYGQREVAGQPYVLLEDFTRKYQKPSIVDIKVGFRTWSSEAGEAAILKCRRKDRETTSAALGFKVCGMQVFEDACECYYKATKNWCKSNMTPPVVASLLGRFPQNGTGLCAVDVYGGPRGALAQLRELEEWFESQTEFHFFSASVLILYEGAAKRAEDAHVQVKLVDFAHTYWDVGAHDDNFLGGIRALRGAVSDALEEARRCGARGARPAEGRPAGAGVLPPPSEAF